MSVKTLLITCVGIGYSYKIDQVYDQSNYQTYDQFNFQNPIPNGNQNAQKRQGETGGIAAGSQILVGGAIGAGALGAGALVANYLINNLPGRKF